MRRRLMAGGLLAALMVLVPAGAASAHPLGNFTVNTYSGVRVQPDRVVVDMVVDMAEIPAFQVHASIDTNGDGAVSASESKAFATTSCAAAATKTSVRVGGRSASLRASSGDVTFPPGAAGLSTLRLTCTLVADTGELRSEQQVVFRNANYVDRVGWREITAVGDRTTVVTSNTKASSLSNRLTAYPADLLSSPIDQRSVTVRVRPGGPPAPDIPGATAALRAPQPRGVDALTRSFTALVARQRLSVAFGLLALTLALALGAVHALAPGHGKTVMAAYLVGERGSLRQAGLIALTVTVTHTIGVLVLGTVLSASTSLAPESIYPWLGLASGLLLAAIGVSLGRRALRRRSLVLPVVVVSAPALVGVGVEAGGSGAALGHRDAAQDPVVGVHRGHSHSHDHDHGTHSHGGWEHSHVPQTPDGSPAHWKTLVPMGLAGGMVPSPSALVVLLGAIALGRAWFGVVLVIAYGLGMAATLTGAGLLLVRARGAVERRMHGPHAGRFATLARALPLITSAAIVGGGLYLAARGAGQL